MNIAPVDPALTDRLYRWIWHEEPVPSPAALAAFARDLLEEIQRVSTQASPTPISALQPPVLEDDLAE